MYVPFLFVCVLFGFFLFFYFLAFLFKIVSLSLSFGFFFLHLFLFDIACQARLSDPSIDRLVAPFASAFSLRIVPRFPSGRGVNPPGSHSMES